MRTAAYSAFLVAASALSLSAFAQPHERPSAEPPSANAPLEQREAWCESYANWFLSRMPVNPARAPETRPTQRFETEFNSCILDPQAYEHDTVAELERWGEPTGRG